MENLPPGRIVVLAERFGKREEFFSERRHLIKDLLDLLELQIFSWWLGL